MKISTFFYIQEFVPLAIFNAFGDKSIWFVDRRIVLLADFIRGRFGKVMAINTWHNGGTLENRGFRPSNTTIGGENSQHKHGRAIDYNIDTFTPQEVYADIIGNKDVYMKAGLTTVEDIAFTSKWTHCDIRHTGSDELLVVKPI